jgi:hypothetical protein
VTISSMKTELNTICDNGMPERIDRSDNHSEKRASSAQLPTTAWTALAKIRMRRPINTMLGPSAPNASASERILPILASSDSTVRR